jgi:hypothetical protein
MAKPTLTGLAIATALTGLGLAAPASAQDRSVVRVLPDLIQQATVIATPADANAINHAAHFSAGPGLTSAPAALNAALALQLADLPGAPAAGGVMFSRDGSGDALHNVYGTSYSARGLTLGAGRLGGAITFQDTNYETLDGANIRDGGINFLFTHQQCCGNTNDVLQQTVFVRLNRKVTSFVLNYGVSDRFDVGVVVPIVQVTMAARIASRILRVGTVADPSVHSFDPLFRATHTTYLDVDYAKSGGASFGVDGTTARGFGDIQFSGKLGLATSPSNALAVTLSLSVPTGRSDDFLGTGALRVTPGVAWSAVSGPVSPHVTAGYSYARGSLSARLQDAYPSQSLDLKVPTVINWTAGFDLALAPRVTLLVDALGRRVDNVQRFATGQTVFATGVPGGPPADVAAGTDLITDGRRALSQVFGTVGGRFNLGGPVFATATVFFPVVKGGLMPRTAAVFGIDYGF